MFTTSRDGSSQVFESSQNLKKCLLYKAINSFFYTLYFKKYVNSWGCVLYIAAEHKYE